MTGPIITEKSDVNIEEELEALEPAEGEGDSGFVQEPSNLSDTEGEPIIPPAIEEKPITAPKITEEGKETKPFRTFNTQEEYDEFVEAQRNKTIVENLNKPKGEEKPKEPLKFFEDVVDPTTGEKVPWKPKDWNDFMNEVVNNPKAAGALVEAMTPNIKEKLDHLTTEQEKELDEIDKQYDKEYEALAKTHNLPKLSTDEGKAISKQIFGIGGKYLIPDNGKARVMTTDEMFKMWSSIPESNGGGLEYTTKKAKITARKQSSAFLTPLRKTQPSTQGKKPDAKHIHETDLDSLIEEGLEEGDE